MNILDNKVDERALGFKVEAVSVDDAFLITCYC